jgi:hypothetical protein
MLPEFHSIGIDLGRDSDHSAIAVASVFRRVGAAVDPYTGARPVTWQLEVSHLEQVPKSVEYTTVMDRIGRTVRRLGHQTPYGYKQPSIQVALDAAGPGSIGAELIRKQQLSISLYPIIITGGEESHALKSGSTSVPRKELLHTLRILVESGALNFSHSLRHRERLVRECAGVKASGTSADHDDLVIAVALAAWRATRQCRQLLPGRQ